MKNAMRRCHRASAAVVLSLFLAQTTCAQKPYLSSLSATKDSPLYSTYCGALERSEFTLDEGYHFVYYDSTRGADFTTDMAGDLCLGFLRGGTFVHKLKDMHREPVITTSYGDIVKYTYYPFDHIRVDVVFFVHSSRAAILDAVVRNEGPEKATLTLFPFLHNTYRTFEDVGLHNDKSAMTFTHEELPDGWTLEHGVPYVDNVQNVFLVSPAPDRMTSFRSYTWGTVEIPQTVDMNRKPLCVIWGRVTRKDGSRCSAMPAGSKLMAVLNNNTHRILTETAPRWGSTEMNFNRYSLYGVELGNLGEVRRGDTYRIMVQCGEVDEIGVTTGTVHTSRDTSDVRVDIQMNEQAVPGPPKNLRKDIWGSGTEMRLSWGRSAGLVTYSVYRRDYRASGAYELLAEGLDRTFYTDKNIPGDRIYGYVVVAVDARGTMSMHSDEVNNIAGSDFLTDVRYPGQIKSDYSDHVRVVAAARSVELAPGASEQIRVVRAVAPAVDDQQRLIAQAQRLLNEDLEKIVAANEKLYAFIPRGEWSDPEKAMLYFSAFTLMRQVMLPPEGKCGYNYYVFSREPQWGWGHGGQVFHESLTMLAYAYMDPMSAMNSQRVYLQRQQMDGYINYRTGPYLDETIPENGQLTTSAPWYAWQNWEVYRISKDRTFLKEMYQSSKSFYDYYVKNRDSDGDGLCEWGGEAVLESVRDARVAVWDEVGYPANFEAVDVNAMLVKEATSLGAMARELGYRTEGTAWDEEASKRARKVNETMWDKATGFYYNIDKKNHGFTFKKSNDLKRQEMIGFLPLWAGIADKEQATKLVQKLTDPKKFWRLFGVPSLSADDPYYNPKGYWNGPVWVEWNYLIVRGLIDYGYVEEAKELTNRVAAGMIAQLKKDHNFWEFYSPDQQWAGYHKTYIWAGLIARMLMDTEGSGKQ